MGIGQRQSCAAEALLTTFALCAPSHSLSLCHVHGSFLSLDSVHAWAWLDRKNLKASGGGFTSPTWISNTKTQKLHTASPTLDSSCEVASLRGLFTFANSLPGTMHNGLGRTKGVRQFGTGEASACLIWHPCFLAGLTKDYPCAGMSFNHLLGYPSLAASASSRHGTCYGPQQYLISPCRAQ